MTVVVEYSSLESAVFYALFSSVSLSSTEQFSFSTLLYRKGTVRNNSWGRCVGLLQIHVALEFDLLDEFGLDECWRGVFVFDSARFA